MISESILNTLMEMATLSFVIPVVFIVIWKLRMEVSVRPVIYGLISYIAFVKIVKAIPDFIFFELLKPCAKMMQTYSWANTIYQALMVTVFTGFALKLCYDKVFDESLTSIDHAVSYGLGFGFGYMAMEMGFSNLETYAIGQMINLNQTEGLSESYIRSIQDINKYSLFCSAARHCIMLFLFVAIAVVFFYAVHKKGQNKWIYRMMGILFFVMLLPAFYEGHVLAFWIIDLIALIISLGAISIAVKMYKAFPKQQVKPSVSRRAWDEAKKKKK